MSNAPRNGSTNLGSEWPSIHGVDMFLQRSATLELDIKIEIIGEHCAPAITEELGVLFARESPDYNLSQSPAAPRLSTSSANSARTFLAFAFYLQARGVRPTKSSRLTKLNLSPSLRHAWNH